MNSLDVSTSLANKKDKKKRFFCTQCEVICRFNNLWDCNYEFSRFALLYNFPTNDVIFICAHNKNSSTQNQNTDTNTWFIFLTKIYWLHWIDGTQPHLIDVRWWKKKTKTNWSPAYFCREYTVNALPLCTWNLNAL